MHRSALSHVMLITTFAHIRAAFPSPKNLRNNRATEQHGPYARKQSPLFYHKSGQELRR